MVFHDSRSVFMVFSWFQVAFSWFFVVPGRFSWFFMVLGWCFMVSHGSRLVFMVFHCSGLVFVWSQFGFHGFSWFQVGIQFMIFHGSSSVFFGFMVPGWFFIFHPKTVFWLDNPRNVNIATLASRAPVLKRPPVQHQLPPSVPPSVSVHLSRPPHAPREGDYNDTIQIHLL